MPELQPIYVAGQWRAADSTGTFQAANPATGETLPDVFPISAWPDCDAALTAASAAFAELQSLPPARIAEFLRAFAAKIEAQAEVLCATANRETGYPIKPRLAEAELPRTVNQLRQAADAAEEGSWQNVVIDSKQNIRSHLTALGPVVVFGPNNFPFAFGSASGGDFAAAIAAGCPVVAKANTSHPATTKLFMEAAAAALAETKLPAATVQLIYRTSHADGERLVADPRVGAIAYTGSRNAGLKLKAAADAVGKPIYVELSSVNPVVFLPGALAERSEKLVDEFVGSCLMGTGQFCTNPGLLVFLKGEATEAFLAAAGKKFAAAPAGALLSSGVADSLRRGVEVLQQAGATVVADSGAVTQPGFRCPNTLLRVSASQFVKNSHALQTECFGNESLAVVADDLPQLLAVLDQLEGNLTGCIYSDTTGKDDAHYAPIAAKLRLRVGRLLNDKMPTGVAVTAAMNHGGPFPATGHPAFTAVGIPAAIKRFGMLACYDAVREPRLPAALQNKNPTGKMWRSVDGNWSQGDVA
jgi:alpha-ketoglutaric semialdehyde dehydrogenase